MSESRLKKYYGDYVSQDLIEKTAREAKTILKGKGKSVIAPTPKEEIDAVVNEILQAYGYKSTMSMYGKNRGEGAHFV